MKTMARDLTVQPGITRASEASRKQANHKTKECGSSCKH